MARRALRLLLRSLGVGMLLALCLPLSLWLHLPLPLTRQVGAAVLNELVSGEIQGRLQVGALTELELTTRALQVRAQDVRLFDPDGAQVMQASDVQLSLSLWPLLQKELVFPKAVLEGGRVQLIPDAEGLPSLLHAFEPARDRTGPATDAPLHASLPEIALHEVVVEGKVPGLEALRVQELSATLSLDVQQAVRVRFEGVQGQVTAPFVRPVKLVSLEGSVSSVAEEGVRLQAELEPPDEHVRLELVYAHDAALPEEAPPRLRLQVAAQRLSGGTLRALGFEWAEPVQAVVVDAELDLWGPPHDLQLDAELITAGGRVHLAGQVTTAHGVTLDARTDKLRLSRVMPELPQVQVRGKLQLRVPPEADSRPRIRFDLEPFAWEQIAFPKTSGEAVVESDALRIVSVRGTRKGSDIRGRGRIGFDGDMALQLSAHVEQVADEPNIRRHLPQLRGAADAELRVQVTRGPTPRISMHGKLSLRDFRQGALRAALLQLEGRAQGRLDRPLVDLHALGRELSVHGYALGNADLHVRGGPNRYLAEGSFERDGMRTFDLQASADVDASGITVGAEHITLLVGEDAWRGTLRGLRFEHGRSVDLALLRLASQSQRLEAKGSIHYQGDDRIEVLLQDFDVTAFNALLGKELRLSSGRADTSFVLTGDLAHPELELQGALRDATIGNADGIHAVYFVTYHEGVLEVDADAQLGTRGTFTLDGTGQVDPTEPDPLQALRHGAYEATLSLSHFDISVVRDLLVLESWPEQDVTLSGQLTAFGTLAAPALDGELHAEAIQLPGWPALTATGDLHYREAQLLMSASIADDRGDLVQARVHLPLDIVSYVMAPYSPQVLAASRSWQLEAHTAQRRLDELPGPLAEWLPVPLTLESELVASKTGEAVEATWRFTGDLDQIPAEMTCGNDPRGTLEGTFQLNGDTTQLDLRARMGRGSRIDLQAAAPTPLLDWLSGVSAPSWPALSLTMDTVMRRTSRVPWLCKYADGSIRARLTGEDLLTDDPRLRMELRSSIAPVRPPESRVRQPLCPTEPVSTEVVVEADGSWAEGHANLDGCGGGPGDLHVRLPLAWSHPWQPQPDPDRALEAALELHGSQLSPLLMLVPGISEAEGLGTGSVHASGSFAQPDFQGRVDLQHGALRIAASGQTLSDVGGSLLLKGSRVELDRVVAYDGDGVVRMDGHFGLAGFRPQTADLNLNMSRFPARHEGVSLAFFTGQTEVAASFEPHEAAFAITLERLDVRLPEDTGRTLQSLDPHTDIEVVGVSREPPDEDFLVRIQLDGRKPFSVHRNDFEALVRSELDIRYREADLRVGGYIEFQRGNFEVFGKRFDVDQGSLAFSGDPELDPVVNLRAVHRPRLSGAAQVDVQVTGTVSDPRVTFSSPACEGQSGALTMLISGTCSAPGQQAMHVDDSAMVAGLVSGVLTLGAQRELGRLVPTISIESAGHSYHTRLRARFDANPLIPKFMRRVVRQAYIQGAVSSIDPGAPASTQGLPPDSTGPSTDFTLELHFPYNFLGTGVVSPQVGRWGIDLAWEP